MVDRGRWKMVEMMVKVVEMMVEEDISQLIFLLFTSYFSLFLDFSPCFCLRNTSKFHKNLHEIRIWRGFLFLKRVCNKCEV